MLNMVLFITRLDAGAEKCPSMTPGDYDKRNWYIKELTSILPKGGTH
jgi:hypothetical protein